MVFTAITFHLIIRVTLAYNGVLPADILLITSECLS